MDPAADRLAEKWKQLEKTFPKWAVLGKLPLVGVYVALSFFEPFQPSVTAIHAVLSAVVFVFCLVPKLFRSSDLQEIWTTILGGQYIASLLLAGSGMLYGILIPLDDSLSGLWDPRYETRKQASGWQFGFLALHSAVACALFIELLVSINTRDSVKLKPAAVQAPPKSAYGIEYRIIDLVTAVLSVVLVILAIIGVSMLASQKHKPGLLLGAIAACGVLELCKFLQTWCCRSNEPIATFIQLCFLFVAGSLNTVFMGFFQTALSQCHRVGTIRGSFFSDILLAQHDVHALNITCMFFFTANAIVNFLHFTLQHVKIYQELQRQDMKRRGIIGDQLNAVASGPKEYRHRFFMEPESRNHDSIVMRLRMELALPNSCNVEVAAVALDVRTSMSLAEVKTVLHDRGIVFREALPE